MLDQERPQPGAGSGKFLDAIKSSISVLSVEGVEGSGSMVESPPASSTPEGVLLPESEASPPLGLVESESLFGFGVGSESTSGHCVLPLQAQHMVHDSNTPTTSYPLHHPSLPLYAAHPSLYASTAPLSESTQVSTDGSGWGVGDGEGVGEGEGDELGGSTFASN